MKFLSTFGVLSTLLFGFASVASAVDTTMIDNTHAAAKAATDKFIADNPDHVQTFNGVKAWPAGAMMKVSVYMNHGGMNMTMSYNCTLGGSPAVYTCVAQ